MKNTLIGIVSTAALGAALLTVTTGAWADPANGAQGYGYADNGGSGPTSYNDADNPDGGYADNGDRDMRGYPASVNAGPGPYSSGIAGPGTGKVVANTGWSAGMDSQDGYADDSAGYAENGDWDMRDAGPGPYSADIAGPGTGKVVQADGWSPVSYGAAYGPDAAPAGSPTAAGVCNIMPKRTAQGVRNVEVCE